MRLRLLLPALLLLGGCDGAPGRAGSPQEARAVAEGLANVCGPLFTRGVEKKPDEYRARMRPLGWRITETPGVMMFHREEAWGEVRVAVPSDFKGLCTIRTWAAADATGHDGGAAIDAVAHWVSQSASEARREENRQPQADAPGAVQTAWRGGGWVVVAREQPIQGRRPVVEINVRRIGF
jgi:hypothetical protein